MSEMLAYSAMLLIVLKFVQKICYGIWEGGGGQKALGSYVTTWEAFEVWLT